MTASAGDRRRRRSRCSNALRRDGLTLETEEAPIGGAGYDAAGDPLPEATLALAQAADAVLFGAVGGPKYDTLPRAKRPEQGLLGMRKELGLFANLRPALLYPELAAASTLKPEVVAGLDLLILRELTGDIYFGQPRGRRTNAAGEREGFDTMLYSESEIRRIAHVGFETARKRGKKLCSVDKANVLETSSCGARSSPTSAREYPDVELSHMYVDNAAMQLVREPEAVRRHRHRQHVRRHPVRRGVDAHRLDRHAALGFARRGRQGPLRADPRLGARHRRQGRRQSAGDDPVGGDDVALHLRPRRRRRPDRGRGAPGARRRACAPPTSRSRAKRRSAPKAMGDAWSRRWPEPQSGCSEAKR